MRRTLVLLLVPVLLVTGIGLADDKSPPDPRNRVNAWTPQPAGTPTTIVLQYGPYTVHPGSDLSRIDVEVAPLNGWVISARPAVRLADGTEPGDELVHIHHAHWVVVRDPDRWPRNGSSNYNDYIDWFFGTGEEKTRGSAEDRAKVDPRYGDGFRYGVPMNRGDKMVFVSMLHNKTSQPMVLWLEGRFEFVHGTRDEIKAATGLDYHKLTPTLHGDTFQVPRTGGTYVWPRDLPTTSGNRIAGVGHVWEAPFSGTIVVAAGHLHPGGREVVVSNLGSPSAPCGPSYLSDPDDDGFAGVTIQRIQAYYPEGAFPSEGFQMGVTKNGWRGYVRKGDRIAINGIYDATDYAYPDAMSFFGFFTDESAPPPAGKECTAELIDQPGATQAEIVDSRTNREWEDHDAVICNPCDNLSKPLPTRSQWTNTIHSAGFRYVPGDLELADSLGVPFVRKGERVTFYNEDWAAGLVRHSFTTCRAPCNGGYALNHPFHDGVFDSGPLGVTLLDTYHTVKQSPVWTLDTSNLPTGYYTYYCRLHTWMRGGFYIDPAA